jgi:hypothetical protein
LGFTCGVYQDDDLLVGKTSNGKNNSRSFDSAAKAPPSLRMTICGV